MNVATNSGSNAIHGSAYDFVRNTIFNARDTFALQNSLIMKTNWEGQSEAPCTSRKL